MNNGGLKWNETRIGIELEMGTAENQNGLRWEVGVLGILRESVSLRRFAFCSVFNFNWLALLPCDRQFERSGRDSLLALGVSWSPFGRPECRRTRPCLLKIQRVLAFSFAIVFECVLFECYFTPHATDCVVFT